MQRDLILHIGLSKTGSSSIQRVLADQREALRAQGVYMPESPGRANHALLPASLVNDSSILWGFNPGVWEGLTHEARLARFRQEWAAELDALPGWATRCLISAEQVAGLLRADNEVQRLADGLRPHFAKVLVVVYLRRQDLHAASAYSQSLRMGVLTSPGLPAGGPGELPDYDYGAILDRFARVFGEDSIRPRIFDRASLAGGDVVEDFLRTTGIELTITPEASKNDSNLSITPAGQNLLLQAGRHMEKGAKHDLWRDTPEWRRLAEAVGETLPGRGWRPTRGEASAFMQRFAATNEHARRRFFRHLPTLFPLDFSDLPETPEIVAPDSVVPAALDVLLHEIGNSAAREAQAAMTQFRLLKRLGDRPMMRKLIVRAIRFAPDLLVARTSAAALFLEEGDFLQAREHAEAAHRIAPDDPQVERLLRKVKRGTSPPAQGGLREAALRERGRASPAG